MSGHAQLPYDDAIPEVPSPYEGKTLSVGDHVAISAYWFGTNFLWGALLAIMLPKEIKDIFPYDRVQALSVITAFAAVIALIVPLFAGALSDRCASRFGRRRPYIAAGIVINIIGLALMAFAIGASERHGKLGADASFLQSVKVLLADPKFVLILISFMVVQAGNNVASAAYSGVLPDLVPVAQRGTASGYYGLMSQAGALVGAASSGLVFSGWPLIWQYMVLAIVLVGAGLVTLLGIKETPLSSKPNPVRWGSYLKSLWIDPKAYPDFAWVWITRALVMLGFYAIQPYINYYLYDVVGINDVERTASILLGLILVMSSVSAVYGGRLSDRIGRKRVVYIANSAIAVTALMFIFCRGIVSVCAVGSLFGLAYGAYISVDWALGTDVLPSKEHAAKEMAVWHISMTLPQSVAGPIAGMLISGFGVKEAWDNVKLENVPHYNVIGYTLVFCFMAICFALGALGLRNVRGAK